MAARGSGSGVELRAFRGTRRSSVYRAHVLGAAAAERIAAAGGSLTVLARPGSHRLEKPEARRLADEATRLRTGASLLDLDDDLTALAEVANWCARATGPAWARVARRG